MAKVAMADSIAHVPEFAAWYKVIKDTLADFDIGKLLIYIIDTVDASLLPTLAEQFDVLGYKGFKLAQTEFDQRQIIKRSIELHKYKGTEWAIKEALKSIGFADIELIKTGYDHWAKFGVRITNEALQLTDNAFFDITQMVKEYKRAVCVLEEILVTIQVEDNLFVNDVSAAVLAETSAVDSLNLSGITRYDGQEEFDGSHNFSSDEDVAQITEI